MRPGSGILATTPGPCSETSMTNGTSTIDTIRSCSTWPKRSRSSTASCWNRRDRPPCTPVFWKRGAGARILASGVSDGFLQLLLLLTALFSEGERASILLFDEPEVSLHPWALAVFAKAVKVAAERWNKQIFLATHSPVLISQFEPRDILVAGIEDGRARFDRLHEIEEIRDLLEDYAAGSLYMSEAVAPQGPGTSREGEE